MSKKLKEQLSLADFIADNKKDIMAAAMEELEEVITDDVFDDADFVAEIADKLPGPRSWQAYSSRDWGLCIVTNVKGEGFPDWDDVLEAAAKRVDVPVSLVKAYCTDAFLDQWFWDDAGFEVQDLDKDDFIPWDGEEFVVVGRSGGYWGVKNFENLMGLNYDEAQSYVGNWLDNFEAHMQNGDISWYGRTFDQPHDFQDRDGDWSEEEISSAVSNALSDDPVLFDLIAVSKHAEELFSKLGEYIAAVIKDFESVDRWVDGIEANEYYYKDAADAGLSDEDMEDDYWEGKANSQKALESLKRKEQ